MKQEEIITYTGKTANRKDCRKIEGDFYLIGDTAIENSGECYKINGKFYKAHTGFIIYDHAVKQYVIKNMHIIVEQGVVGFKDNGEPILGAFSKSIDCLPLPTLKYNGKIYEVLNEELLKNNKFFAEDLTTGIYVKRDSVPAINFFLPLQVNQDIKRSLPYDCKKLIKEANIFYEKYYKPKFSKAVNKFGDYLGNLTFGLEFESTKGIIPERITKYLGLIPVRDGSIEGLEYVTIPLQGKKGVQTIVDSLEELNKRTDFNDSCSLHIHIGGMPRSEEFILAFMRIIYVIQDSIYELFPLYKKGNYGVKRKNYTKPYEYEDTIVNFDRVINEKNIKENFGRLYKFLSGGQRYEVPGQSLDNVNNHPSDPRGEGKWNINSRYYWVNIIPLIFGNKKTIEFRIHNATYDPFKVVNYLFLCGAIIKYVDKHKTAILSNPELFAPLKLDTILFNVFQDENNGEELASAIYHYLLERKDFYFNEARKSVISPDEEKQFSFSKSITWENYERNNKGYYKSASSNKKALEKIAFIKRKGNNDFIVNIKRNPFAVDDRGNIQRVQEVPRFMEEELIIEDNVEERVREDINRGLDRQQRNNF